MTTHTDQGHLARARVKFEPVAQALNRLAKDIEKEHGRSAVLGTEISNGADGSERLRGAVLPPASR
jgi:hypothetical protein